MFEPETPMLQDSFSSDSEEDCQILEEIWIDSSPPASPSDVQCIGPVSPSQPSTSRATVITGQKRGADSQKRGAAGFKRPALQVTIECPGTIVVEEQPQTNSQPLVPPQNINVEDVAIPCVAIISQVQESNQTSPVAVLDQILPCGHSSASQGGDDRHPIPATPSTSAATQCPDQPSSSSEEETLLLVSAEPLAFPAEVDQVISCPHLSSETTVSIPHSHYLIPHVLNPLASPNFASSSTVPNPGFPGTTQEVCEHMAPSTLPPSIQFSQENVLNNISSTQGEHGITILDLSHINGPSTSQQTTTASHFSFLPGFSIGIWQGTVHYLERNSNNPGVKVDHPLACAISSKVSNNGMPVVDAKGWPSQLMLNWMPGGVIKDRNLMHVLKTDASQVYFHFSGVSLPLQRLQEFLKKGWMGCVQFYTNPNMRMMITVHLPSKNKYIGYIPHDQNSFYTNFISVYDRRHFHHMQRVEEHQTNSALFQTGLRDNVSPNSLVLNSTDVNSATENPYVEIDNQINAHITALRQRNQNQLDTAASTLPEREPSQQSATPQPLDETSTNTISRSIEARLERLETAQNESQSNVDDFEEIDRQINARLAGHWLRHFTRNRTPSTSHQPQEVPQQQASPSTITYSSNLDQSLMRRMYFLRRLLHRPSIFTAFSTNVARPRRRALPREALEPYTPRLNTPRIPPAPYNPSPPRRRAFPTAAFYNFHPISTSAGSNLPSTSSSTERNSSPPAEDNPIEAQAKEIFPADLVKRVVLKKLVDTGNRFTNVEELCDAIIRYEESRPKPSSSELGVSEEVICKICMDQRMNCVFSPCGHLLTCVDCAQNIFECPLCRAKIVHKMKIYMS